MFTIEIQVHPWGNSDPDLRNHVVGLAVANDGTGSIIYGNYDVWEMFSDETPEQAHNARSAILRVENWPRNNAQSHLAALSANILTHYAALAMEG